MGERMIGIFFSAVSSTVFEEGVDGIDQQPDFARPPYLTEREMYI